MPAPIEHCRTGLLGGAPCSQHSAWIRPTRRATTKTPGVLGTSVTLPLEVVGSACAASSCDDELLHEIASDALLLKSCDASTAALSAPTNEPGLAEVSLLCPWRGAIINPTGTTCFLGSLLQALNQVVICKQCWTGMSHQSIAERPARGAC